VACGGVHNLAITEPDQSLANSLALLVTDEMLADVCFVSSEGSIVYAHLCIFRTDQRSELVQLRAGEGRGKGGDACRQRIRAGDPFGELLQRRAVGGSLRLHALCLHPRRQCCGDVVVELRGGARVVPPRRQVSPRDPAAQVQADHPPAAREAEHTQALAAQPAAPVHGAAAGAGEDGLPAPAEDPETPAGDGWGIFFLPGGQALVLNGDAYRETLRKGTLLDLCDADAPSAGEGATVLEERMRTLLADEVSHDVRLVVRGEGAAEPQRPVEMGAHKCVLVPVVRSPALQSQREVALARQLADLQRQLQQLQQPSADTGATSAPVPPWATDASPQAARRARLAEIGNILKSLGTADAEYRAKLLAERTSLQEQLQSEKPLESNVSAQNRKVTEARKKKANCAAKVQAARDAVEKAKEALAKAEAAETEAEEDVEEMAVDQEGEAHKHIDEMDAPTCREHLRSCGLEVPAPGDVDDDDEAPVLRDRLKRHLANAQGLAKKLKATAKRSICFVFFVEFDGLRAPCERPPCEFSGLGIGWRGAREYLFDLGHARTYEYRVLAQTSCRIKFEI
ncbi:unnamed protein product, partial [Prorocentrum cordatum]